MQLLQILKLNNNLMLKRCFDLLFSILGLIVLFPILLLISICIILDSKGPILFIQGRVGKNNIDFNIYKFRTMRIQSQKKGLLTLGNNDSRITKIGYFLRRYKIDEFPQLINILKGDMSFVGPRPELRYYVNFYNEDDLKIFKIRPGITGLAQVNQSADTCLEDVENKLYWDHAYALSLVDMSSWLKADIKIILQTFQTMVMSRGH